MKWYKFISLSWADRLFFIIIAQWLIATRVALTVLSYKSVVHLFERISIPRNRHRGVEKADRHYVDKVVLFTNAAGRRVLGSRPCLPKALIVECLLKRQGFDASLQIGVTKDLNGQFLAHAWVDCNGDIVIGGRLSEVRYSRLRPIKTRDQ